MLDRLFKSNISSHEFDIPEIKINKKITQKTAFQHEDVSNPNLKTEKGEEVTKPQKTKTKRTVNELSSIEKHYYDQMKGVLKNTSKSALRDSITKSDKVYEISKKELLEILEMC